MLVSLQNVHIMFVDCSIIFVYIIGKESYMISVNRSNAAILWLLRLADEMCAGPVTGSHGGL